MELGEFLVQNTILFIVLTGIFAVVAVIALQ